MLAYWISFALSNFDLAMFALAAIFMLINTLISRGRVSEYEITFRWMSLFALGFTGLYAAVMHLYFPVMTAQHIGWQTSPFQFEVGVANLGIGLLGVIAFRASYGFRLATVISAVCFLGGCAVGHVLQLYQFNNLSMGNAGSWFWMDVIIPVILAICINKMNRTT